MKFLFDFFPIILFFMAYKLGDIYFATIAAIFAAFLQVVISRLTKGHFEKMHVITLGMLVVFGGATLYFRDPLFIKWKPTALYWLLSIVFFASQVIGKKPIMQRFAEHNLELPNAIWRHLNASWGGFFAFMGALNIYVAYNYIESTWVNFKLFGSLGLTLVFVLVQAVVIGKHVTNDKKIEVRGEK